MESSPEFQASLAKTAKRKDAAAKAVETKTSKTVEWSKSLTLKVTRREDLPSALRSAYWYVLDRRAREWEDYSANYDPRPVQAPRSTETYRQSLTRSVRNHLRHTCTNYDGVIRRLSGRTGKDSAYTEVTRRRADELVATSWPDLDDFLAVHAANEESLSVLVGIGLDTHHVGYVVVTIVHPASYPFLLHSGLVIQLHGGG